MGVFNFVDDSSAPGCALLKLSDGRKRSMSLWVEFITASGYLSARKIRARFYALVSQACEKCACKDLVRLITNDATSGVTEVKLKIRDQYIVNVVPAFKCTNTWPRAASQWPTVISFFFFLNKVFRENLL
jgi:putative nucleotidyltransferase